MGQQNSDNFDGFAESYHTVLSKDLECGGTGSEYFAEYKVRAIREMITEENGSILDFGCGDGTTAAYFRNSFPSHRIAGIDISQKSIGIAAGKNIGNSEFRMFENGAAPFPSGSFSLVFMANVLHHVPERDHAAILIECLRVLEVNGRIAIFEHNPLNPVTRRIVRECVFDREATLLMPWGLEKKLSLSGFQNSRLSFHLFFPRHKLFAFFLRLERYLRWIPLGAQYCIVAVKGEPLGPATTAASSPSA